MPTKKPKILFARGRAAVAFRLCLGLLFLGGASLGWAGGIGNLVFRDQNRNRHYDPADAPVANVTLHLYTAGQTPGEDQPLQVEVTDAGGRYFFGGVAEGDYFVYVVPTAFTGGGALLNTRSVPGTPGAADADDDEGENGIDVLNPAVSGVRSGIIHVAAGTAPVSYQTETGFENDSDDVSGEDEDTDLTVDFGFEAFTTRVGDFVWLDTDRDGLQDEGEPGLQGIQVQLFNAADEFVATTTSAADGYYGFTNVDPGTYYLRFPAMSFPYQLTVAEQDPEDLSDSDVSVLSGTTPSFEVMALQNNTQYDAGYVLKLPDIGDYVFYDPNNNGVQDPGEGGIEGVVVELHDETGALIDVRESDVDGYYHFSNVMVGRYYLQFPLSAGGGLVLSPMGQSLDSSADSDPDPGTGMTPLFDAEAGLDDSTRDAGYHQPPATIRGTAWHDVNKNGIREEGEEPVAGVTVILQDVATDEDVAGALTDDFGNYEFAGLPSRAWRLQFVRYAGPLNGYQLTMPDAGDDDTVDSDVQLTDLRTASVTPTNGETVVLDAGYKNVRMGLGNGVFKDLNGNGTFNAGEGVPGVTVELYAVHEIPELVGTTTTSVGGTYYFQDLQPGNYFVKIPASEFGADGPLAGWISLPGDGEDDQLDDNLGENGNDEPYPAGSGIRSNVVNLEPEQEPRSSPGTETGRENTADNADDFHMDLTVDFGFTPGMTVGNLVFVDRDGNGIFSPGEGVGGVELEIYEGRIREVDMEPLGRVITDAAGHYQFSGLQEGRYRVNVSARNFRAGQVLEGYASLTGDGIEGVKDDDQDENGEDGTDEMLAGVSSRSFFLLAGQAPTQADGETGDGSDADDAADAMGDLTVDFGFANAAAGSYEAWLLRGNANGNGLPDEDVDGDGWSNVMEYFFNFPASGGTDPQHPFSVSADPDSGHLSLSVVINPRAGEAVLMPECRADLAGDEGDWQSITGMLVQQEDLPDGTRRLTWSNLETLPGMDTGSGFVRLSVTFDMDGDGLADYSFSAGVIGWRERSHRTGLTSTGFSLLKPSLHRGTVTAMDTAGGGMGLVLAGVAGTDSWSILPAGMPCYVEVDSGAYQGHRFEIDEAASTGTALKLKVGDALNTLSEIPDLSGSMVTVRAHWTLGEVFPVDDFVAANSPAASDRILRFTRPSFTTFWLLQTGGTRRWVQADDVFLTDAGKLPIPPGEGLFMERAGVVQGVLDIGEVRDHRMARRLTQGNSLVTSGWPAAGSPRSWGMLEPGGFAGTNNPSTADSFQLWQADTEGGQRALRGYFLLDAGPGWRFWTEKGDATLMNRNDAELFAPGQGIFVTTHAPETVWFEPCPYTP